jgi:two-component system, LytTR family, sensor kinase
MKTAWYNRTGPKILTHIVIWAIVLSLPWLLNNRHGGDHHISDKVDRGFFYLNTITNFLWIGPFYLNAYFLVPRLFYNRRYVLYIATLLMVLGGILAIHLAIHRFLFSDISGPGYFTVKGALIYLLPAFLLTVAISTAIRLVRDKMRADAFAQLKQAESLKTELSFLRSQINPHFIFNILNNLVALERMKSPELGPTILKLSGLMQYMLYETDEENVRLTAEVDYLQSYIDLQRQRFGEKVDIQVCLKTPEEWHEIEPMLLIPFVENAFKHGVGMIEDPTICINLHTTGNVLHFSVKNKYNDAYEEVKDKTSGIGLSNVKRRLNLLYGDQHSLLIAKEQDWFTVSLQINLH